MGWIFSETEVRMILIGQYFSHTSTETHNPCLCRKVEDTQGKDTQTKDTEVKEKDTEVYLSHTKISFCDFKNKTHKQKSQKYTFVCSSEYLGG